MVGALKKRQDLLLQASVRGLEVGNTEGHVQTGFWMLDAVAAGHSGLCAY